MDVYRRWLEADLQVEMLEVDFVKVKVSWEIAQFSPAENEPMPHAIKNKTTIGLVVFVLSV
jgi:hypothetical protein